MPSQVNQTNKVTHQSADSFLTAQSQVGSSLYYATIWDVKNKSISSQVVPHKLTYLRQSSNIFPIELSILFRSKMDKGTIHIVRTLSGTRPQSYNVAMLQIKQQWSTNKWIHQLYSKQNICPPYHPGGDVLRSPPSLTLTCITPFPHISHPSSKASFKCALCIDRDPDSEVKVRKRSHTAR